MKPPKNIESYQSHYSEKGLGNKLGKVAKKAGARLVYPVLLLYYVLKSPFVTKADKTKIYGALGYFILPVDLVPDLLPMLGYADDLSAVLWALHTVWKNVTPEIKAQAAAKAREWFGDFDQNAIDDRIAAESLPSRKK